MSEYLEGCWLRFDEIAAVLSLAGKQSVVGFQPETLTSEGLWSACCRLVRDRLLTQTDGRFSLCRELAEVMEPVCNAAVVLAVTPASDLQPQLLYYVGRQAVSMVRTPFGPCCLTALAPQQLCGDLCERMELTFSEETKPDETVFEIDVQSTDPCEVLLKSAQLVVEQLDVAAGFRKNWLRVVPRGIDLWLQWTQSDTVCCGILTQRLLEQQLQALMGGASE